MQLKLTIASSKQIVSVQFIFGTLLLKQGFQTLNQRTTLLQHCENGYLEHSKRGSSQLSAWEAES